MMQKGEELCDYEAMMDAGMLAISEDGKSVMNSEIARRAMREAARLDLFVCAHCEDINLVQGGVMNMDENSERLGLKGISNATEDIIAARDIMLAKETGARLHLCHCSTEGTVQMVEEAKKQGVKVTAEVTPHHFSLSSDDIPGDDPMYKMNPPLRSRRDVEALKKGLADGIMDCISTDHAPHTDEEKSGSMKNSPFGITGLETAAALAWTNLVQDGTIDPVGMAKLMSFNPANIAGIDAGTLNEGAPADLVLLEEGDFVVDPARFASKGKNTPFAGAHVGLRVKKTICGGEVIYEQDDAGDRFPISDRDRR